LGRLTSQVYSRAEHLRRHQYNHQGSPQLCKVCNKAFFREDLLTRHLLKHGDNHDRAVSEGDASSIYSDRPSSMQSTPSMMPSPPTTLPPPDYNERPEVYASGSDYRNSPFSQPPAPFLPEPPVSFQSK
jgi:uncharacterized Zn-finger protein